MIFTDLSTIALVLAGIALIFALAAMDVARKSLLRARESEKWLMENAESSVTRAHLAKMSGEITDLVDSYEALLKNHNRLRSRISMRENREKKKAPENGAERDPDTVDWVDEGGKAAYKAKLRREAKASGLLR